MTPLARLMALRKAICGAASYVERTKDCACRGCRADQQTVVDDLNTVLVHVDQDILAAQAARGAEQSTDAVERVAWALHRRYCEDCEHTALPKVDYGDAKAAVAALGAGSCLDPRQHRDLRTEITDLRARLQATLGAGVVKPLTQNACTMCGEPFTPERPAPVIHMHGEDDGCYDQWMDRMFGERDDLRARLETLVAMLNQVGHALTDTEQTGWNGDNLSAGVRDLRARLAEYREDDDGVNEVCDRARIDKYHANDGSDMGTVLRVRLLADRLAAVEVERDNARVQAVHQLNAEREKATALAAVLAQYERHRLTCPQRAWEA